MMQVSHGAYYNFINARTYQVSTEQQLFLKEVKAIFDFHKKRYGLRRVHSELKDKSYKVGLYKVRSAMKTLNLEAIQPKCFVPRTTQDNPHLLRSPNLLLNMPVLDAPNQVIVGDITYLPTLKGEWLYLAVWMDLYSRKIVGWKVDDNMKEHLVIDPFKQVIKVRQPSKVMIVHSDGGGQYKSVAFRTLLKQHQFRQSMTRKDNHYDNAFAESLFSRFKAEVLDENPFKDLTDAKFRTFEYIEAYYNTIRKHSALGYLSPQQFEDRYWRTYSQNDSINPP